MDDRIRKIVYQRFGGKCFYCDHEMVYNEPNVMEIDHAWPRSRGGSDDLSNLVLSCYDCNRKKRDSTMREFAGVEKEIAFKELNRDHPVLTTSKQSRAAKRLALSPYTPRVRCDLAEYWQQKEREWDRKITIAEVAKSTGLSRDTISRMRRSTTSVFDESSVKSICRFFQVPKGPIPFFIYR